jgi:diguanylate cyclase (GGDEF)-like protein/PAS domain S-box-containing protein
MSEAGGELPPQPLEVLLIEDSADDADLIARELERAGFEPRTRRVETAEQVRSALADEVWDIALSDHVLPDVDSTRVLELRASLAPDLPVIVVSGAIGEEAAVAALRHGAADYVNKDHLERLGPAVRHGLREIEARRARRAAEAALAESEERFRASFENAPVGMALVSVEPESLGRFMWVNRTLCTIAGMSKERLLGLGIESIASPEDGVAGRVGIKRLLAGNESAYSTETRYERRDGSTVWVEVRVSLIRDERGGPLNFLAQVLDLTERKQGEEVRAHLAAIVESSEDAIVGQDLDGTIVSWNRGAERLYGYRATEVVGRPISVLVPEDRSGELEQILGRIRRGERIENLETVRKDRNGHWIAVSLSMSPVVAPDGRVSGVAAIARDITERKEFEAQLQFLADHDVLTGLINRRRFIYTLSHHIDLVNRYGPGGAVLILDLDNFKEINDTLGHRAGDETIRAASGVLNGRLRSSDVLARLSGDEFAVLLAQADEEQARLLASDLLELLRQHPIFVAGRSVRITASVGVALFQPKDELDSEGLLASADVAMYQAKEAGRDQLAIYSRAPERQTQIEDRLSWPDRVRTALANGSMSLFLQPIKDLRSGHVSQWEALVRLREGDETILPGAFLGPAERSGLVIELDRWVVTNAIELIARQRRLGHDIRLEVNLSGRSVGDEELPATIAAMIAEHGIDADRLIFEVTETAAIANMADARGFAESLTRLGCQFALDDFGAGFGSFYYLKYLPLDFLKIDGDFIRKLKVSEVDQVLVRGMVEVARGLGVRTIAEFVEDQETLELLREYGIDYAQGFHVGRPEPAPANGQLVTDGPRALPAEG